MIFEEPEKDVELRLALRDSDFLRLISENVASTSSGTLDAERTLRLQERIKQSRTVDVEACYSAREGSVTFRGLVNRRLPFRFRLRRNSRSYTNVLSFLLDELKMLGQVRRTSRFNESGLGSDDIVELIQSLEKRLESYQLKGKTPGGEMVDLFRADFESSLFDQKLIGRRGKQAAELPRVGSGETKSALLKGATRKFRLFHEGRPEPQLISGFFSLGVGLSKERAQRAADEKISPAERLYEKVSNEIALVYKPEIKVEQGTAQLDFSFSLNKDLLSQIELFVHWGPQDSTDWVDEEILPEDIVQEHDVWSVSQRISVDGEGEYGATVYVRVAGSLCRYWLIGGEKGDLLFAIEDVGIPTTLPELCQDMVDEVEVQGRILRSFSSVDYFVRTLSQLEKTDKVRGLGRVLFDLTSEDRGLRSIITDFKKQIDHELNNPSPGMPRTRLARSSRILDNLGVGEIVFVAPEGPHAIAGGLAQVIVGLSKSLSHLGISCTLISPLYEESQGNKHRSAEEYLKDGVPLLGTNVPLEYRGEIAIPFGSTKYSDSKATKEFRRIETATVYSAENQGVRVFFLRHSKLANTLYPEIGSDDQLRRAIFLSRGAIEIVKERQFGVNAHIMLTNDWLSALVPVFLKADPRYAEHPRLKDIETCHVLHNAGRAYQGKLYVNHFGEDLWPMLGIADEHFFGIVDPEDGSRLNLTAGAAFHSSKGVLAVSKPYADQLLTQGGGEGLDLLLKKSSQKVFGISNGVDLSVLRTVFWQVGERARKKLGLSPLLRRRLSQGTLVRRLPLYKQAAKSITQARYGLEIRSDAILMSLVGRLAEQKGIQLLSEKMAEDDCSALEYTLRKYPEVQFFIGGPPTKGDSRCAELQSEIAILEEKYPGRIASVYDFIPHQDALAITQASDFFLMPSRYEPGGITQLEALATGTIVIAHNVGGLKATLRNFCPLRAEGDSFLFNEFNPTAIREVIERALDTFQDRTHREVLLKEAAEAENDWNHRSEKYLALLQSIAGVFSTDTNSFRFLNKRELLLEQLRASTENLSA